nr:hypothetical protein [Bacillus sp. IBL03825]
MSLFYMIKSLLNKEPFDHEPTDEPITEEETIHIPVTAEKN